MNSVNLDMLVFSLNVVFAYYIIGKCAILDAAFVFVIHLHLLSFFALSLLHTRLNKSLKYYLYSCLCWPCLLVTCQNINGMFLV